MKLSIRARLTIWYSGLLAAALLAFSLAVYFVMASALLSNLDTTLRQRLNQVAVAVRDDNGHLGLPNGGDNSDDALVPDVLLDPRGHVLLGTLPPDVGSLLAHHPLSPASGDAFRSAAGTRFATRTIYHGGAVAGYALVYQSLKPVDDARHALLLILLGAGPLLLVLAGAGGYALARRGLRPVAEITSVASAISTSDLHRRVPDSPVRDELSALASTFNAMIARLESGMERERRFTADASHELRSPLAVIRAEATLALDRPRDADEYRRVLAVIDDQAATMEDLVAGLLLLARAEALREVDTTPVSLGEIVAAAVRQCHPPPAEREVSIETSIPADLLVLGAPALLQRAVRNVIDNAVKASPRGGAVRITGRQAAEEAVLVIEDEGPGIPEADRERIFEPFYQVAAARTPGESHGLGLAICRRIVTVHGGSVRAEAAPGGGARFVITLPITSSPRDSDPDPQTAGSSSRPTRRKDVPARRPT